MLEGVGVGLVTSHPGPREPSPVEGRDATGTCRGRDLGRDQFPVQSKVPRSRPRSGSGSGSVRRLWEVGWEGKFSDLGPSVSPRRRPLVGFWSGTPLL